MIGIYSISNKINGKVYVGQSVDIENRFQKHQSTLRKGKHRSIKLQRAYNLYGEPAFEYSVLELCERDDLDKSEIKWIQFFNSVYSGYNSDSGGNSNKVLSEEHKKKISLANLGKVVSVETRQKISQANIGHPGIKWSEEKKREKSEKMMGKQYRLGKTGQTYSNETKEKMSKAKLGNTNAKGSKRTAEEIQRIIETNHKKLGKKYKHSREYLLSRGLDVD